MYSFIHPHIISFGFQKGLSMQIAINLYFIHQTIIRFKKEQKSMPSFYFSFLCNIILRNILLFLCLRKSYILDTKCHKTNFLPIHISPYVQILWLLFRFLMLSIIYSLWYWKYFYYWKSVSHFSYAGYLS